MLISIMAYYLSSIRHWLIDFDYFGLMFEFKFVVEAAGFGVGWKSGLLKSFDFDSEQ